LLCEECHYALLKRLSLKSRKISKYNEHQYLLNWNQKDRAISKLVRYQKGESNNKDLYDILFSDDCLGEMQECFKGASLVACPPKAEGEKDHAAQLAEYLSKKLKLPLKRALYISSDKRVTQKQQAKKERFERSFIANWGVEGKIIFIDDVVTTGASFMAAQKALEKAEQIQCFSLFYRTLGE
jgi:predicted amidophosphoribosyltransferase